MHLAMEIFLDNETEHWGYAVPALSIVGTGCRSKEEARRLGYRAIEAHLSSVEPTDAPGVETVLFEVEIAPATEPG